MASGTNIKRDTVDGVKAPFVEPELELELEFLEQCFMSSR